MHSTVYHSLMAQLADDLVNHGWGEFTFIATSTKDNVVRVQIDCGKSYIFYIKKEMKIDLEKVI